MAIEDLMREMGPLHMLGARGAGMLPEFARQWAREAPRARSTPAKTDARAQAIERLEVQAFLAPLAVHARRTKKLRDGMTGWCVRAPRADDCWHACVATVLQVPIGQVPDSKIDERLRAGESPREVTRSAREEIDEWLANRGLRMVEHHKVPVSRRRWIGVVPLPGWFNDHSMVMDRGKVLFDPTTELDARPVRIFGPQHVRSGYSFQAA